MLHNLNRCIGRNSFDLVSRYARLKRLFDIIELDRVISKSWKEDLNKYRRDYSVEGELRSIICIHVHGLCR